MTHNQGSATKHPSCNAASPVDMMRATINSVIKSFVHVVPVFERWCSSFNRVFIRALILECRVGMWRSLEKKK